jgi:hypothetical protein
MFLDQCLKFGPAFRAQFLAVVKAVYALIAQDHCRSDNRSGERPPACFVNANDHMRHGG